MIMTRGYRARGNRHKVETHTGGRNHSHPTAISALLAPQSAFSPISPPTATMSASSLAASSTGPGSF